MASKNKWGISTQEAERTQSKDLVIEIELKTWKNMNGGVIPNIQWEVITIKHVNTHFKISEYGYIN
jgi:hypothetical protein